MELHRRRKQRGRSRAPRGNSPKKEFFLDDREEQNVAEYGNLNSDRRAAEFWSSDPEKKGQGHLVRHIYNGYPPGPISDAAADSGPNPLPFQATGYPL